MPKKSNKYRQLLSTHDFSQKLPLNSAIELILKSSLTKFNSTVEMVLHCNLDTTKSEQQMKGTFVLPNPVTKPIKILLLDDQVTQEEAIKAGADHFGGLEKIDDIKQGWLDFDLIITNPNMMKHLSKLGKILGPKGLMPSPKMGTVTNNVLNAVTEFKKGKISYNADSFGNLHLIVGKADFSSSQLEDNCNALINFFLSKKPSTVKKSLIKKIVLTTTMGPSVVVQN